MIKDPSNRYEQKSIWFFNDELGGILWKNLLHLEQRHMDT